MALYKVVRRWYTVQQIEAPSEDEAIMQAKDAVVLSEEFEEEDYEVELVSNKGGTLCQQSAK